ncbi:unnamed protein product [Microthlaspi erraticum]|uniref:Uncharacterized protein n=1 Tax=Microthlaspi erraticum TaxID=1685480 RepID=A0A6D2KGS7_9BRAS|nr:unnamed protein product [Microthlaspi erraticum]
MVLSFLNSYTFGLKLLRLFVILYVTMAAFINLEDSPKKNRRSSDTLLCSSIIAGLESMCSSIIDEMVLLAGKFKETCLVTRESVLHQQKILDSIDRAIEQSLASTGHANVRASKIYSESSKTSRVEWILSLVSMFVFIIVVLLIRAT